ncbi:MAG: M28 family peptidase, partial [Clostridia bacterium]
LTASGMALAVVDYLRQHGEKVPDNCQIILASFGCKECGAKGSEQFILEHWNRDSMLINPNVINFESVKPKGTKVIFGEKQQRLAYDRNLSNVVFNSFKDDMLNPTYENNKIMFTDAAPFAYRKIPATTIRLNAEHTGEDLQFDEAFMSAANAVVKTLEFLNNERARIIEKEKNAASI